VERDEFLRAAWKTMLAEKLHAGRLVFVDEMGANTSLALIYAWSRRGERARYSVPRNRGKNTTLLASMTLEGMGPCLAVEGTTTAAVFEAYVEQALVPTLRAGKVVVMDNPSLRTRARGSGSSWSRREAASFCTCHPTRRTLTPSRKPSLRSRVS
jgi:hypothetical protein